MIAIVNKLIGQIFLLKSLIKHKKSFLRLFLQNSVIFYFNFLLFINTCPNNLNHKYQFN